MRGNKSHHLMRTVLFLLLCTIQPALAWADWTVAALMQELASSSHPVVQFSESKTLSYLDVPLSSNGGLRVGKNGQLTKETISPQYERLIIDSDTVKVLREGDDEVTLELSDYPVMRGFIEAFRATLLGDVDSLSKYYKLEMKGERKLWSLQLYPLQATLAAVIRIIEIEGSGDMINSFIIEEQSGDSTTLMITEY